MFVCASVGANARACVDETRIKSVKKERGQVLELTRGMRYRKLTKTDGNGGEISRQVLEWSELKFKTE